MQKDFNMFNEITHMPLRVYNRAVFTFNLMSDVGVHGAEEYLDLFSVPERAQIFTMVSFIKSKGPEAAKNFATKGLVLEEDVAVA